MSYKTSKVPREMPRTSRRTDELVAMPRASLWRRVWGEIKALYRAFFRKTI